MTFSTLPFSSNCFNSAKGIYNTDYYCEAIATSTAYVFKLNYEPLFIVLNLLVMQCARPKRDHVYWTYISRRPLICLRRSPK
ncbi:hypothetical protein ACN38_g4199 [Penicillium nordicum]|uniref:Uncharacterized protein n=1 Tax=Penicillium nordicum TaxID=229535 RepID=A0A0M8PBQ4_9EURO|nr:hypothetical protein ACN38_g4199 [Penicillium nordicum]